jgi:opacity protein-like surface antigen
MKKIVFFAVLLSLLTVGLQAVKLDIGFLYGSRSIKDTDMKEVYGNGSVYFPYLAVNVWKGLTFGLGYEGGYDRDGKIGLYQEGTSFKMTGIEFFAAYRLEFGKLSPYLKLGFGSYSYKQDISNVTRVDDKKSGLNLAVGIRYYVIKGLFLAAEAKYVPLKVMPIDQEVDLSGMRLAAGLGYTFNL